MPIDRSAGADDGVHQVSWCCQAFKLVRRSSEAVRKNINDRQALKLAILSEACRKLVASSKAIRNVCRGGSCGGSISLEDLAALAGAQGAEDGGAVGSQDPP